jgi:hypothetical protein
MLTKEMTWGVEMRLEVERAKAWRLEGTRLDLLSECWEISLRR